MLRLASFPLQEMNNLEHDDPLRQQEMRQKASERLLDVLRYQKDQLEKLGVFTPEDFELHACLQNKIATRTIGLMGMGAMG